MKEGLFKLVNGEEVLVTDHPLFREHILINLLPQKEHFLFITQDKGIYEGTPNQLDTWKVSTSQLINTSPRVFRLGGGAIGPYHHAEKCGEKWKIGARIPLLRSARSGENHLRTHLCQGHKLSYAHRNG